MATNNIDIENILEITLESSNSDDVIKISKEHDFHLISITGLGSAEQEVILNNNIRYDGAKISARRIRHRNIVMDVEYDGEYKLETRNDVIKFFNIHHNGFLSVLYGTNRKKIGYVVERPIFPLENVYNLFRFRVSLICPDPFFTDYEDNAAKIVEWKKSLVFPVQIPKARGLVFGKKSHKSSVNVYNSGDVKTGMQVVFKAIGDVVNPYIINTGTRERIFINKEMVAGEIFIVDTNDGSKGVELINEPNGEKNGYRYLSEDSDFIQLDIGDNIIRYGADENINNLEVTIHYKNKYLGV